MIIVYDYISLIYFRNDMRVSCHTDRYWFGVFWASCMLFVYPVGVTVIELL